MSLSIYLAQGFDQTERIGRKNQYRIRCSQCQAAAINGVFCHETGCPKESAYLCALRVYERFECSGHGGITVDCEEPDEFDSLELAEEEHRTNRYYHSTL